MSLVLAVRVPWRLLPDPGTGREWLRDELAHPKYRESLVDRFNRWFDELVSGLQDVGSVGINPVLAVVLLVVLVGAAAFLLSRLRANPASAEGSAAVFDDVRRSAAGHRHLADSALAAARWDEAVVEAVRALASGLFERGLVEERPNVTVQEIIAAAGHLFPRHRERLTRAGRVFDETRYGGRAAGAAEARDAVTLERELSARPPEADGSHGPVLAVPR